MPRMGFPVDRRPEHLRLLRRHHQRIVRPLAFVAVREHQYDLAELVVLPVPRLVVDHHIRRGVEPAFEGMPEAPRRKRVVIAGHHLDVRLPFQQVNHEKAPGVLLNARNQRLENGALVHLSCPESPRRRSSGRRDGSRRQVGNTASTPAPSAGRRCPAAAGQGR